MTSFARRWLRPWMEPLRDLQAFWARRAPVNVDAAVGAGGHVHAVVCTAGVVSAQGWSPDLVAFGSAVRLRVAGGDRPPTHVFRVPRPTIDAARGTRAGFLGAVAEWVIEPHPSSRTVGLVVDGRQVTTLSLPRSEAVPYGHLHTHAGILRREDIYGFGPPNRVVSEEVVSLARALPAPVLDFGCGAGALVVALRREGVEAYGLEIDDARIRGHLLDEATPHVTLYDGTMPTPYSDRQFASVVCSEVLEHIAAPHAALAEMARLASRAMLVTVPDMSAIPRGYAHAVVPWHLLESTHVNFFTQASLHAALAPHAARIEMSRLGLVKCDRMQFYSSLAAMVERDVYSPGRPSR